MRDKKLWTEAVFMEKDLDIWEILKRLRFPTVNTKILKLKGNAKRESMETRPLKNRQTFKEIIKRIALKSPFLEHLYFNQIWFDWNRDFTINKFPPNLRSLHFNNCILPKDRRRAARTFTNIFEHMPHLEELRLEYCNFFAPNDLMPLSKLNNLKILSLRGCKKFRNCVPYISLSCRFGFKKLEVLDLRATNISDSEVQCLNALKSLKELYLEYQDVEPAVDDDSDDDDYQSFYRSPFNRRDDTLSPQAGAASDSPVVHLQPSTSAAVVVAAAPIENDEEEEDAFDAPSSPESLSDSLPSESSSPTEEEVPSRTIYIQANIMQNLNPNARVQVIISDAIPHASRFLQMDRNREQRMPPLAISDRGILAFGVPRQNLIGNLVFLGQQGQPDPNTYLEKLILRNFENITDTTLSHLETNAPKLVLLDIRGCTRISRDAIDRFKVIRSTCQLLSNFDYFDAEIEE